LSDVTRKPLVEEKLTESVIGAFCEVYNALGYGFSESICMNALEHELTLRGHRVRREVYFPVIYKGRHLGRQRVDRIVDDRLVVEGKASDALHKNASRQVYNYLKLARIRVGLLLNFGPEPTFYRFLSPEAFSSSASDALLQPPIGSIGSSG
jgi:GxxExxY protein